MAIKIVHEYTFRHKMKKPTSQLPNDYRLLLEDIKKRVRVAQYGALRAVNKELVTLYWGIGKDITERQLTASHGSAVVKQLFG